MLLAALASAVDPRERELSSGFGSDVFNGFDAFGLIYCFLRHDQQNLYFFSEFWWFNSDFWWFA